MVAASLPLALTPFIGRDEEVDALRRLLDSTRLLTLTGAGGSGKTRLALELAAKATSNFPDGVMWIELAPLGDAELLPTYVLAALGVEQGGRTPMNALVDTLRDRRALLVLDNCEHIVEACASLADALLRSCPTLHVLATSREALGVGGERAWLVPGLALPAASDTALEKLGDVAAVRLFVDRAQAAVSSFRLTPANAPAIAQITRRLDGLPLAIELAAARVRTITPEQLAPRLDDAFRVLTAGARTAVPRHRTLREAIDWSYNLLDERERLLLQRLSMFAGDFTLHAAESVGAGTGLDVADVLDTLGALVDKSLVGMRESEGTARFHLLETIRQYASERLRESGHFHQVCFRHAQTYMDLVAEAAPKLITRDRPAWVQRLHREIDNIRVALACTRESDVAAHLRMAGNLGWFWYSSGLWSEGRRWMEGALALPSTDATRHERASVLLGAGVLASLQADIRTAVPWLEESAALFQAAGDAAGEAYALAYQGVSWGQSADERTLEPTTRALAHFRATQDLYGLRLCLVVLSTYHAIRGNVGEARLHGEEGVAIARAFGLDRELAIALQVLAGVHLAMGDLQEAERLYRESLGALRRDPSLFWIARGLQLFAFVNFSAGRAQYAATLMGVGEVVRESMGAGFFGHDRDRLTKAIEHARREIGDAAFDAAWRDGRAMLLEDALEMVAPAGPAAVFVPQTAPVSGPPLDVRALGALEIRRDGVPLPHDAWRYARPRELLLYLLAHQEGRTREQIGLVFWPDASTTQVKNNFHVMLHHVRKALGAGRADLIVFERDRYRIAWERGVRFDAQLFEQAVRSGLKALRDQRAADVRQRLADLSAALELYRGDFLAEEEAGDWHLEIRDRLRRTYVEAALLVGDRLMVMESAADAASYYRRVVTMDDVNEDAARRLMTALAKSGDRSGALREYDRLRETLRRELATEPERATKALYEQLKSGAP